MILIKRLTVVSLFLGTLLASVVAQDNVVKAQGQVQRTKGIFTAPTPGTPTTPVPPPSDEPSGTPSDSPSDSPSEAPSAETAAPTVVSTDAATGTPTKGATQAPTGSSTEAATTGAPTEGVPATDAPVAVTDSPTGTTVVTTDAPTGATGTASPTVSTDDLDVCVMSWDHSGKVCHSLIEDENSTTVAEVCVYIAHEYDVPKLQVTFKAVGSWKLVRNKFWLGTSIQDVPLKDADANGTIAIDLEAFSVFACNSTGVEVWTYPVDIDWSICTDATKMQYVLVAFAEAETTDANGDVVPESAVTAYAVQHPIANLGYFDFDIACDCSKEPEDVCIATMDHSGKLCHTLNGEEGVDSNVTEAVAQVCVEVVYNEVTAKRQLQVTFDALGEWKLVTNKFWFGEDVSGVPKLGDGSTDLEAFEYFICNSTGIETWTYSVNLDLPACASNGMGAVEFSMIAFTEVELTDDEGLAIRSTAFRAFAYEHSLGYGDNWMGWFDFKIECECGEKPDPRNYCPDDTPELYVKSTSPRECHAIVAGGDMQSMQAGEVCVEIDHEDGMLEVTFEAGTNWALLRSQLWVGFDTDAESAWDSMPHKKSGAPDTKKFKDFACDWKGEKTVSFKINLDVECVSDDEIRVYVVAHSKVEQVDEYGALIPGSDVDVFAFEHTGDSEKWYGWFDFMIGCRCPTTTTPAPSSLPSPTDAPTSAPTEGSKCEEEMSPEDVEEICYDMTAPEAWEPEAGTVCISITNATMDVTYRSTNYWAIFESHVWWGDNIADVPMTDGTNEFELYSFQNVNDDLEGETNYTVQLQISDLACDANDEYRMVIVAQALVGEPCIPPNGTAILGTDRNAYGGDQEIANPDFPYYYIEMPIDCICGPGRTRGEIPPVTGSPVADPTGSPTASPTGTPLADPTAAPTASPTGTPTGSPVSDCVARPPSGVSFGPYSGNPQCYQTGSDTPFGFDYGWKMDGCSSGTYTLNSDGEMTGSCEIAGMITLNVECNDDKSATISWSGEGDSYIAIKPH
ncbi:expressed unknown protein [Seminavis robusta]|uniref:Uncharacterized protein n=1 Tax=Seminavis robusta TaxID=568900 RepID=A0A9N8HPB2_9STRA|nr:expressed unknown protein [Seminavis robusta]|eukprot:Sro1163_g248000.1 n/a (1019) ;mRNA; f:26655-29809